MDGRTLTPVATPQRVQSGLGTRLRQLRVSAGLTQSELAGDRLQNVYEMERGRDVLQDVDYRDELITLALQLRDLLLQPGGLRVGWGIALDR